MIDRTMPHDRRFTAADARRLRAWQTGDRPDPPPGVPPAGAPPPPPPPPLPPPPLTMLAVARDAALAERATLTRERDAALAGEAYWRGRLAALEVRHERLRDARHGLALALAFLAFVVGLVIGRI